jgi:hypothetical protein
MRGMCQPSGLKENCGNLKPVVNTTGRGCADPPGLNVQIANAEVNFFEALSCFCRQIFLSFFMSHPERQFAFDSSTIMPQNSWYVT